MTNNSQPSAVRPGYHRGFDTYTFGEPERKVLGTLANEFYLTNPGNAVSLGKNAQYRYFLLKVPEEYTEEFNLSREVVCVFANYKSFEPRTLDAFDTAFDNYQSLRLENVCRILISADDAIQEHLDGLIKSDPEQPIIVPFTYGELSRSVSPNFLRGRFRKYFFTRNLFDFFSPLQKDLYFFGRTQIIQHLVARHDSSENSGLFGLRRSGKTSVIYGVERSMAVRGKKTAAIDCQSPSVHQVRWNELLHRVAEAVRDAKESKAKISERSAYTPQMASDLFEQDMLRIHSSKKAEAILLIFDEIERISPATAASEHWRTDNDFVYFWQSIRSFFQRNRGVFTFMLVGTNPACIEASTINGQDNPIFGFLPHEYLAPFEVDQVAEMVGRLGRYMGLDFDPMLFGRLTDDFGGHPFLIRQVCSEIHELASRDRPTRVDKPLYELAKSQFNNKSSAYLGMILDVLAEQYKDEYEMLRYLASGDIGAFEGLAATSPEYTAHLKGYGLITTSRNGTSFRIECIKDFMTARHKYTSLSLTPEQRDAEVAERRAKLEQNLRKIIRNQLKATFGAKAARDKLLASLPDKRKEQLASFDIDRLLAPTDSPLFLLELINTLSREWDAFKNILPFEKPKAVMMLEEINRLRRDAHSNSVTEEELLELRLYFSKFESALDEWL